MTRTNPCYALCALDKQKCGIESPPGQVFCQQHHTEHLALQGAYEQATKDAEELEATFAKIGLRAFAQEERDASEVRADRDIAAKYVETLQSAIRGREETKERFSCAAWRTTDMQYLDVLVAKLPGAKALAQVLEGGPTDEETKKVVLRAAVEAQDATRSIPEARYSGRTNWSGFSMCEAQLRHTYQRCGVMVNPINRFCAGHHEDFKALKEGLDRAIKHTSEYRDKVRWGLQHRDGRDPGVPGCDFPTSQDELLLAVEMYIAHLRAEIDSRESYGGWFSYLPTDPFGDSYRMIEENKRLMRECSRRMAKAAGLRDKLERGWYAALSGVFGARISERDVE